MGDDDGTASAPGHRRQPLYREIAFYLFAGLVLLGVGFYLWWGLLYGTWRDNGVYAVTIVLVMFGLSGMWLMTPNPPAPAPAAGGGPSP